MGIDYRFSIDLLGSVTYISPAFMNINKKVRLKHLQINGFDYSGNHSPWTNWHIQYITVIKVTSTEIVENFLVCEHLTVTEEPQALLATVGTHSSFLRN